MALPQRIKTCGRSLGTWLKTCSARLICSLARGQLVSGSTRCVPLAVRPGSPLRFTEKRMWLRYCQGSSHATGPSSGGHANPPVSRSNCSTTERFQASCAAYSICCNWQPPQTPKTGQRAWLRCGAASSISVIHTRGGRGMLAFQRRLRFPGRRSPPRAGASTAIVTRSPGSPAGTRSICLCSLPSRSSTAMSAVASPSRVSSPRVTV